MSGCIGCANQPGDNGSLGGAAAGHEGAVTPMVIGIIIGTVAMFVLVVCALFYCVKLENNRYMAKIGDCSAGGPPGSEGDGEDSSSVKSRPSSVTIVPPRPPPTASMRVVGGGGGGGDKGAVREVLPRSASVGASVGSVRRGEGKRRLFAWGRKSALPADNSPVTAIEMV